VAFTKRSDGVYVRDLAAFKRVFPYVMKTRTESVVYFDQKIDVSETLSYLESVNEGRPKEERVTFFHLVLAATVRILRMRPELNRFVVGRRIYAHKEISATFIVKKALTEEAPEAEARLVFSGDESPRDVSSRIHAGVRNARSGSRGSDDKLIDFVAALPRPLIRLVAWTIQALDFHNVLPRFMMGAIPLYTSVYITNVGSIGIEPPFHHLYEFGSASLFMAIGRIHKEAFVAEDDTIVARPCVRLTFTLDERISEGFYYARSLILFQRLIEHPSLLDCGEIDIEDVIAQG